MHLLIFDASSHLPFRSVESVFLYELPRGVEGWRRVEGGRSVRSLHVVSMFGSFVLPSVVEVWSS